MTYEKGMQIIFDMVSGMTIVEFRGQLKTLGPFKNQREANIAGEDFCRIKGWSGSETRTPVGNLGQNHAIPEVRYPPAFGSTEGVSARLFR